MEEFAQTTAGIGSWLEIIQGASNPELLRAFVQTYAPFRPFVIQLLKDGRRTHVYFFAGNVQWWWDKLFGHRVKPIQGVWYDISRLAIYDDVTRRDLDKVLFDAHGYAEAQFERTGIDPRQKPFVPCELPNIEQLKARQGERCDICYEPWGPDCVAESPLLL